MKLPVAMARRAGNLSSPRPHVFDSRSFHSRSGEPTGYTLVEILVATALTLLLMAGVVTLFGQVTDRVARGQAMMELGDRLRATQHRLQTDLKYHTARMIPPLDPRDDLGYLEILDGPGPYIITGLGNVPINQTYLTDGVDNDGDGNTDEADEAVDSTVGDIDDVLMLTVRSYGEPFLGRFGGGTMQSQVAEVAWFVRGTTLYRRVLLVVPQRVFNPQQAFYRDYDVSVHQEGGPSELRVNWGNNSGDERLISNSLGDLTKRENRYGHLPLNAGIGGYGFPHDARLWGALGLPTLRECSHNNWPYPLYGNSPNPPGGSSVAFNGQVDFWTAPHPWGNVDAETGTLQNFVNNNRMAEDVILTNVLSFDVKIWDPDAPVLLYDADGDNAPNDPDDRTLVPGDAGYLSQLQRWTNNAGGVGVVSFGAYVDLFYLRPFNNWQTVLANMFVRAPGRLFAFAGPGTQESRLQAGPTSAAVYDTGSTHYEYDGSNQADWVGGPLVDEGTDGLDNNNVGGVDDISERETLPPYPVPLRSVQIKIRVYERDTQQIREVTVTQDFLK